MALQRFVCVFMGLFLAGSFAHGQPASTVKANFNGKWNGHYKDNLGKTGEGVYDFREATGDKLVVIVTWGKSKMELNGKRLGKDGMRLEGTEGGIVYRYIGRMEKCDLVLQYLSVEEKPERPARACPR